MTCIVGLVDNGSVYLGADSAGVAGWELSVRRDSKVFAVGDALVAFTASFRSGQLLRYRFSLPEQPEGMEDDVFMATLFVDAVRDCFKEGGYARKDSDQEFGGDFLVGYRGHLYHVMSDYQVGENYDPYDAAGCGAQIALGALYATETSRMKPENRVVRALQASERFSNGVRGPFTVMALRP